MESMDSPANRWKEKRVRTPTVLQMEGAECGAAALAIILAHFGRRVPLEKLREDCGVSRDGSKAGNVVKAARKYGLVAEGYRKEPEGLFDLPLPLVLFWNFNHFVVLEGIKGKTIYLNDPAQGPRRVDWEELDESFTGVVLAFRPGPDFQKGGHGFSLTRALMSRLGGMRNALVYSLLVGILLALPGLVSPTFSKIFVDFYLVNGEKYWVRPLLWAMVLTAILYFALTLMQQGNLLRLQIKLAFTSSANFLSHVLHLPSAFFDQRFSGEVGSRVQLNDTVAQLLSGDVATNAINSLMVVFFAALMWQYDPLLTLVGAAIAGLNLLALKLVSRLRVDLNQRLLQERGKQLGTAMAGLQQIETLKASGSESDFFSRWSGYQAKVVNADQTLGVPSYVLSNVPEVLTSLSTLSVLSLGAWRVMQGNITMGELVAFQGLMSSFHSPVTQLVGLGPKFQDAEGDLKRLEDVLHYQQDETYLPRDDEAATPAKLSGTLELRDISFGYNPLEPPLVQGLDLKLAPGSRVALVGASGSGKSTVAKLVAGLVKPWGGEVLFDGLPRHRINREVMTGSMSMVDQEIFLFEGTVRENLTLWDHTIGEADVVGAARDACIHEDITRRSGTYDSIVAEGGGNFSGGQRQRLEIARALVNNPTILILDEATSALDANTEKLVDSNLRRRGCTCIIVAHRLSTIRDADEILVLDHGRVVQRGTHESMLQEEGPYADLIRMD